MSISSEDGSSEVGCALVLRGEEVIGREVEKGGKRKEGKEELTEHSFRRNEMRSICMIEIRDAFTGEFQMLGLIFANGNVGCSYS